MELGNRNQPQFLMRGSHIGSHNLRTVAVCLVCPLAAPPPCPLGMGTLDISVRQSNLSKKEKVGALCSPPILSP